MISRIEVTNLKGFRNLNLGSMVPFHVLAGPNGSGKSTFLEIFEFIKDLLLQGDVQDAIARRNVSSLRELTFARQGGRVAVSVSFDETVFPVSCPWYRLTLSESDEDGATIASEAVMRGSEAVLARKIPEGIFIYTREDAIGEDRFSFPVSRPGLAQVPPDEVRFPTANRIKRLLTSGIQALRLNSVHMGSPCPPRDFGTELQPDGRNLARVAGRLLRGGNGNGANGRAWISHLQMALEDLEDIQWRQREDDKAEFLVLRYRDGLEIPGWLASFGTLRTLALTLPAFLPREEPALYLFEEPENGIHPYAIEIVMQAIQTIPNAQVFVTTHSPMIVQQAGTDALLLFTKEGNELRIQHGGDNPILKDWNGAPDLASVFASRVLG